jgi:acyl-CoA synthetase (AMP-forming)/AMP-acid ligase II
MRISKRLTTVSVFGLWLAGCAATPENVNLVQARDQLVALESKAASNTLAALETRAAVIALEQAEQTSLTNRKNPKIDQEAYIASQKIA